MPYVLHNRLGSGGFPVEVMLSLSALDHSYEPIDSVPGTALQEQVHHVNGWGQVPALETPGGDIITETAAILAYLDQTEPACRTGPLWNDNPGQFLRWCVFLSVNVYESILRRVFTDRYVDFSGCDEPTARDMTARVARAGRDRAHQALSLIEAELDGRPFLLGPRMSAADVYLAMLSSWHGRQSDLTDVAALTERVACHARIAPIWAKNFAGRPAERWDQCRPAWS